MLEYEDIRNRFKQLNITDRDALDVALNNFRILFAYNSGKIENDSIDFHDTREIFENGKAISFTGDPRALFEQQNQKLCYEYLAEKIISKQPINIALILEVHLILTSGTYDETRFIAKGERPGAFKKHDYVTGINEVGSVPAEVEEHLNELLSEIEHYDGDNVIKAAAYFHAKFENIHPFADGNGRVGRTLLNYFLLIKNEPPIIIYNDDKKDYYYSLEAYDAQEEIDSLTNFLKAQTIKSWKKTFRRR